MKKLSTCIFVFGVILLCEIKSGNSDLDNYKTDERNRGNYKRKVNNEINEFYGSNDVLCSGQAEKYETLIKSIDNYVQRYVSLFLKISNLMNYTVKDKNEVVFTELEISLSGEELAFLQELSRGTTPTKVTLILSKLNVILSNMAKMKEKRILEESIKSSKVFLLNFIQYFDFGVFTPYFVILLITCVCCYFYNHKSVYLYLSVLINCFMIWESLVSCKKKIKMFETEKYYQAQMKSIPVECDPANRPWYYGVHTYFFGDKCLQYLNEMNKEATEEVFLLQCIADTYSHYFIHIFGKLLGASTRAAASELSADMPIFLKQTFQVIFSLFILAIFVIGGLLLFGGKILKFSFFGSSVELGDAKPSIQTEKTAITNEPSQKETKKIVVRKKLRAWTKSRFPRRLELEFRRRKMIGNVYKYDTD